MKTKMFSCFLNKNSGHIVNKIPVKVWNCDRTQKVGILAASLSDLSSKVSPKLHLKTQDPDKLMFVFEEDGAEVDDDEVFRELTPHTTLLILQPGETWKPDVDKQVGQVEQALTALLQSNKRREATQQILNHIHDEHDPELLGILGLIAASMGQNIQEETKTNDPDWFQDQSSSKTSKSAIMRDCAKRRVRKYYNTAMDHVKSKHKGKLPDAFEEVFDNFQMELKVNDYYGDYFDRNSSAKKLRLCDGDGWFACEGSYDVSKCSFTDHRINPYGSRANYIVFSTWNLDHRIEKSREILPQLIKAQNSKPKNKDLNWQYFYDLLYTRKNLRLVHTSCHDKTEHDSEKCDPKKFYL